MASFATYILSFLLPILAPSLSRRTRPCSYFERALAIRVKALGDDRLDVGGSLDNIGAALQAKYAAAALKTRHHNSTVEMR
eukprot:1345854-Rhodomonas_salina.2